MPSLVHNLVRCWLVVIFIEIFGEVMKEPQCVLFNVSVCIFERVLLAVTEVYGIMPIMHLDHGFRFNSVNDHNGSATGVHWVFG